MTDAELLSMALRRRLAPSPSRISWEKQCRFCSRRIYDGCHELNLAGLPVRCARIDTEERGMLREALRVAAKS